MMIKESLQFDLVITYLLCLTDCSLELQHFLEFKIVISDEPLYANFRWMIVPKRF